MESMYKIWSEDGFWDNEDGWVSYENSDNFSESEKAELNLPLGGVWLKTGMDTFIKYGKWDFLVVDDDNYTSGVLFRRGAGYLVVCPDVVELAEGKHWGVCFVNFETVEKLLEHWRLV